MEEIAATSHSAVHRVNQAVGADGGRLAAQRGIGNELSQTGTGFCEGEYYRGKPNASLQQKRLGKSSHVREEGMIQATVVAGELYLEIPKLSGRRHLPP